MSEAEGIRDRTWIVAQIGARQHYSIPLGFERLDRLQRLYTDLWCGPGARWLRRLGGRMRSLAGRYCAELPAEKVVAFNGRHLFGTVLQRRERSCEERYLRYLTVGRQFAADVNRHLLRNLPDRTRAAFFSFNTGCLETLRALRERGVPTVVDQIDPARIEEEIVREEVGRWPGWEGLPGRIPECYFEHMESEWETADVVLVNSTWCRDALVQQGVEKDKIAVAPIAFTLPDNANGDRRRAVGAGRPFRVLWLGQVNLRKGIQYLLGAARMLERCGVEFRVIGPIVISERAQRSAPANVRFEGPVARLDATAAYRWADVFVLPTLSDGFAITQLEAMAHGVPVIATPNCGDVVTSGHDGFVVPPRDAAALAEAISTLADDRLRAAEMSANARATVAGYSVDCAAEMRLHAIEAAYLRTTAVA